MGASEKYILGSMNNDGNKCWKSPKKSVKFISVDTGNGITALISEEICTTLSKVSFYHYLLFLDYFLCQVLGW